MGELQFGRDILPTRLCVLLSRIDNGGPLAHVPFFVYAVVQVGEEELRHSRELTLGTVATDHAGYLSYDLAALGRRMADLAVVHQRDGQNALIVLRHLWVRPYAPVEQWIDALNDGAPVDEAMVLRLSVEPTAVFTSDGQGFTSMQTPSLLDWYLSPGSFSHMPVQTIGVDGCETLLPSNVATQRFAAGQVLGTGTPLNLTSTSRTILSGISGATGTIVDIGRPAETRTAQSVVEALATGPVTGVAEWAATHSPQFRAAIPREADARLAVHVSYDITWYPVGHGLGQVLYSVALAPGEQVNLAVVDWARRDDASRHDDVALSDTLRHDTLRDRTVGEVVDSTLREYQRGSSEMGGTAGVGGYGGFFGGSHSLGAAAARTSGSRELAAHTTQSLIDRFHQASTAVRDLRSTVVLQSNQEVSQNLQTRTVRNYNHAHAMTLLYYEVLRHYRVVVERGDVRAALLLPQETPDFAEPAIFSYRRFLEPALLEPGLRSGFEAIEKYFSISGEPSQPAPPHPGETLFALFQLTFVTGGVSSSNNVTGELRGETNVPGSGPVLRAADGVGTLLANPWSFDAINVTVPGQAVASGGPARWKDMHFLALKFRAGKTRNTDSHNSAVASIDVRGVDQAGIEHHLGHIDGNFYFDGITPEANQWVVLPLRRPAAPPPAPTPLERLSEAERYARTNLITHLNSNKAYYYRQIWLGEDPNARLNRLSNCHVAMDGEQVGLFEVVDNRVVDVIGNHLVFLVSTQLVTTAREGFEAAREHLRQLLAAPARTETLISLPTRGVFGEAKLGHCNSAEIIEDERFWDWQKSPIPDSAPAISGVGPQGLGSAIQLTPAAVPGSLINIVNPSPGFRSLWAYVRRSSGVDLGKCW